MIIDYDNLDKDSKDYFDYYLLGSMSEEQAKAYKKKRDKELAKISSKLKKVADIPIISFSNKKNDDILKEVNAVLAKRYRENKDEYDAISKRLKAKNDKDYPIWVNKMQEKINNK